MQAIYFFYHHQVHLTHHPKAKLVLCWFDSLLYQVLQVLATKHKFFADLANHMFLHQYHLLSLLCHLCVVHNLCIQVPNLCQGFFPNVWLYLLRFFLQSQHIQAPTFLCYRLDTNVLSSQKEQAYTQNFGDILQFLTNNLQVECSKSSWCQQDLLALGSFLVVCFCFAKFGYIYSTDKNIVYLFVKYQCP